MTFAMTTATAPSARFLAFEHSAPIVLRDVEDLHDADLDGVLADRLADGYRAADVAAALAHLVGQPGPAALVAHDLDPEAALLAVR
jgi:hypothetical protein